MVWQQRDKPGYLSYCPLWFYCPCPPPPPPRPMVFFISHGFPVSWTHCSEQPENDHWSMSTMLDCLDGIPDQRRGTGIDLVNSCSQTDNLSIYLWQSILLFSLFFSPLHVLFCEKLKSRKVTTVLSTTCTVFNTRAFFPVKKDCLKKWRLFNWIISLH